ncbi:hypothetical protein SeLEV6574_g04067, partial [Synchytrium endobioticum]
MVNIVSGYLEYDERPAYLKPPSKDKNTPMKRKADEGGAASHISVELESLLKSSSPDAITAYVHSLASALSKANDDNTELLARLQAEAFGRASTVQELHQCRSELSALQSTLQDMTRRSPLTTESLNVASLNKKLDDCISDSNAANAAIHALKLELSACHRTISTLESSEHSLKSAICELERNRSTLAEALNAHQSQNVQLHKELAKYDPIRSGDTIPDARLICRNCGRKNAEAEMLLSRVVELKGDSVEAKNAAHFHKSNHLSALKQLYEERHQVKQILQDNAMLASEIRVMKDDQAVQHQQIQSYMSNAERAQQALLTATERYRQQVSIQLSLREEVISSSKSSAVEQTKVLRAALEMILVLTIALRHAQDESSVSRARVLENLKETEEYQLFIASKAESLLILFHEISKRLTTIRRTIAADRTSSSQRIADDLFSVIQLINSNKGQGAALTVKERADLELTRRGRLVAAKQLVASLSERAEKDRQKTDKALQELQKRIVLVDDMIAGGPNSDTSILDTPPLRAMSEPLSATGTIMELEQSRQRLRIHTHSRATSIDAQTPKASPYMAVLIASTLPLMPEIPSTLCPEDLVASINTTLLVQVIRDKDAQIRRLKEGRPAGQRQQRGRGSSLPASPTRRRSPPGSDATSAVAVLACNRILEDKSIEVKKVINAAPTIGLPLILESRNESVLSLQQAHSNMDTRLQVLPEARKRASHPPRSDGEIRESARRETTDILSQQLGRVMSGGDGASQRIKELEEERDRLNCALTEVIGDRDRVEMELSSHRNEFAQTRATLEAANALLEQTQAVAMTRDLNIFEVATKDQITKDAQLKQLFDEKQAEVSKHNSQIANLKNEREALERRVQDLETQMRITHEEKSKAMDEIVKLKSQKGNEPLHERAELARVNDQLSRSMAELESHITLLQNVVLEKDTKIKELSATISNMRGQHAQDMSARVHQGRLQEILSERDAYAMMLEGDIAKHKASAEDRKAEATAAVVLSTQTGMQLEENIALLELSKAALLEKDAQLKQLFDEKQAEVSKHNSQIANLKNEREALERRVQDLETQMRITHEEKSKAMDEIVKLKSQKGNEPLHERAELARVNDQLSRSMAELESHITLLQNVVLEKDTKIKELSATISNMRGQHAQDMSARVHQGRLQEILSERDAYAMMLEGDIAKHKASAEDRKAEATAAVVLSTQTGMQLEENIALLELSKAALLEKDAQLKQLFDEKQAEVSKHNSQIANLKNEREALERRVQDLETQMRITHEEKSKAMDEIVKLKSQKGNEPLHERAELARVNDQLSRSMAELESHITLLQNVVLEKDTKIKELSATISNMRGQHAQDMSARVHQGRLQEILSERDAYAMMLEGDIAKHKASAEDRKAEATAAVVLSTQTGMQLEENIALLELSKAALLEKDAQLKQLFDEKQAEVSKHNSQIANLKNEREALERRVQDLETQMRITHEEKSKAMDEIVKLKSQKGNEPLHERAELARVNDQLSRSMAELESHITLLQNVVLEKDTKIKELSATISNMRGQHAQDMSARVHQGRLQEILSERDAYAMMLEGDIAKHKASAEDRKAEATAAVVLSTQTGMQLEENIALLELSKAALLEKDAQLKQLFDEKQAEVSKHNSQIANLKNEREALERRVQDLETQMRITHEEKSKAMDEIVKLKSQKGNEPLHERAELARVNDQLSRSMAELESHITLLQNVVLEKDTKIKELSATISNMRGQHAQDMSARVHQGRLQEILSERDAYAMMLEGDIAKHKASAEDRKAEATAAVVLSTQTGMQLEENIALLELSKAALLEKDAQLKQLFDEKQAEVSKHNSQIANLKNEREALERRVQDLETQMRITHEEKSKAMDEIVKLKSQKGNEPLHERAELARVNDQLSRSMAELESHITLLQNVVLEKDTKIKELSATISNMRGQHAQDMSARVHQGRLQEILSERDAYAMMLEGDIAKHKASAEDRKAEATAAVVLSTQTGMQLEENIALLELSKAALLEKDAQLKQLFDEKQAEVSKHNSQIANLKNEREALERRVQDLETQMRITHEEKSKAMDEIVKLKSQKGNEPLHERAELARVNDQLSRSMAELESHITLLQNVVLEKDTKIKELSATISNMRGQHAQDMSARVHQGRLQEILSERDAYAMMLEGDIAKHKASAEDRKAEATAAVVLSTQTGMQLEENIALLELSKAALLEKDAQLKQLFDEKQAEVSKHNSQIANLKNEREALERRVQDLETQMRITHEEKSKAMDEIVKLKSQKGNEPLHERAELARVNDQLSRSMAELESHITLLQNVVLEKDTKIKELSATISNMRGQHAQDMSARVHQGRLQEILSERDAYAMMLEGDIAKHKASAEDRKAEATAAVVLSTQTGMQLEENIALLELSKAALLEKDAQLKQLFDEKQAEVSKHNSQIANLKNEREALERRVQDLETQMRITHEEKSKAMDEIVKLKSQKGNEPLHERAELARVNDQLSRSMAELESHITLLQNVVLEKDTKIKELSATISNMRGQHAQDMSARVHQGRLQEILSERDAYAMMLEGDIAKHKASAEDRKAEATAAVVLSTQTGMQLEENIALLELSKAALLEKDAQLKQLFDEKQAEVSKHNSQIANLKNEREALERRVQDLETQMRITHEEKSKAMDEIVKLKSQKGNEPLHERAELARVNDQLSRSMAELESHITLLQNVVLEKDTKIKELSATISNMRGQHAQDMSARVHQGRLQEILSERDAYAMMLEGDIAKHKASAEDRKAEATAAVVLSTQTGMQLEENIALLELSKAALLEKDAQLKQLFDEKQAEVSKHNSQIANLKNEREALERRVQDLETQMRITHEEKSKAMDEIVKLKSQKGNEPLHERAELARVNDQLSRSMAELESHITLLQNVVLEKDTKIKELSATISNMRGQHAQDMSARVHQGRLQEILSERDAYAMMLEGDIAKHKASAEDRKAEATAAVVLSTQTGMQLEENIALLELSKAALLEKDAQLKQLFDEKQAEVSKHNSQIANLKNEREALERRVQDLETQMRITHEEKSKAMDEIVKLKSQKGNEPLHERAELARVNDQLSRSMAELESHITLLQNVVLEKDTKIKELSATISNMRGQHAQDMS